MKITVTLEPNQEFDTQTFDLEDLGITEQEWDGMSEEDKHTLIYTCVADNIYGMITNIEQL